MWRFKENEEKNEKMRTYASLRLDSHFSHHKLQKTKNKKKKQEAFLGAANKVNEKYDFDVVCTVHHLTICI